MLIIPDEQPPCGLGTHRKNRAKTNEILTIFSEGVKERPRLRYYLCYTPTLTTGFDPLARATLHLTRTIRILFQEISLGHSVAFTVTFCGCPSYIESYIPTARKLLGRNETGESLERAIPEPL